MATLPANISSLSASEKFDLLDALWEDLEARSSSFTAQQSLELDRRVSAYEKDPSNVLAWEQVQAHQPKP